MHFDKLYNIIFENENDLNLKNDLRNFKNNWEDRGVENFPIYMDKEIVLHELRIKKELRGRGIGSLYIDGLKDIANKYNVNVSLEPSEQLGAESLERLKKFYTNLGFKETGTYMIYEPKEIVETKMTPEQEYRFIKKNPTKDDFFLINARSSMFREDWKTIRGIISNDILYAWDGQDAQHHDVLMSGIVPKNKETICLIFGKFQKDGSIGRIQVTDTTKNLCGLEKTREIVKKICTPLLKPGFNFDNPIDYMDFNSIKRRML